MPPPTARRSCTPSRTVRDGSTASTPTIRGPAPARDSSTRRASRPGMVAAVISDGQTVDAGYLTSDGARAALSDKAQAQLAAISGSRNR